MHHNKILSNLLILGSGRIATMLIGIVGTVVGTRYLGPANVGALAFAGAIIGLLGQVNAMGMETFLIRAVARTPHRSSTLVSAALFARVILAIPVPAILALYVYFARVSHEIAVMAYFLALGMIIWSFLVVFLWMLQGLEKMEYVAGSDVLIKFAILVETLVIVLLHGSVVAFAITAPLNNLVLLVVTLYYVRPFVRVTWHISKADVIAVVRGSFAFWAKDVTMTIYSYIDSVILGSLAGARAVGFYSPPTRIFAFALAVPNIVGNATLPLLSRLGIDTERDFARVGRKTLEILILSGMPVVVGLATFAAPVVALLFGPDFRPAVPVLVVLSLCLLPMYLNSQFAYILTGRDQQWRWTGIMMVSVVINVGLNFALIPVAVHFWHNGALGAAAAMLGTELFMTAYGVFILRNMVFESSFLRTVLAALVAGAAQAGVALLAGSQPVLLVIAEALGLGVYGVIVVALGGVPRSDLAILWKTALRRAPGTA